MSREYSNRVFESINLSGSMDDEEDDDVMYTTSHSKAHHQSDGNEPAAHTERPNPLQSIPNASSLPSRTQPRPSHRYVPDSASSDDDDDDDELDPAEFLSHQARHQASAAQKAAQTQAGSHHQHTGQQSAPSRGPAFTNSGSSSTQESTPNGSTPTQSAYTEPHLRIIDKVPNVDEDALFSNPSVMSGSDSAKREHLRSVSASGSKSSGMTRSRSALGDTESGTPPVGTSAAHSGASLAGSGLSRGEGSDPYRRGSPYGASFSDRAATPSRNGNGAGTGAAALNANFGRGGGGGGGSIFHVSPGDTSRRYGSSTPTLPGAASETPLEFVLNRSTLLTKELHKNIDLQASMLSTSDSRLSKIRQMISQNFSQISENNESLVELYSKALQDTALSYESFQQWESKRNKLLSKIRSIKSPDNKYGSKLVALADQAHVIDQEIVDLEARLTQLREKRTLVFKEIEDTSSVLESRTSQYVESFKNLEREGEEAIKTVLELNGVTRSEQEKVVRRVPVDVTFEGQYSHGATGENISVKSASATPKPPAAELAPPAPPVSSSPSPAKPQDITMQPYIIPEPETITPTLANRLVKPVPNPKASTGPTDSPIVGGESSPYSPFEKGYAKGTILSHNAKVRISSFVSDVLIPKLSTYSNTIQATYAHPNTSQPASSSYAPLRPTLDDQNNTIHEMFDMEPILKLLQYKMHALEDLIQNHAATSKNYREYGIIWKDVVDVINNMESKLFNHIANSTSVSKEPDTVVLNLLSTSLNQIRERFEVQVQSSKHASRISQSSESSISSPLFSILLNEIRAIISAISMVSGDDSYLSIIKDLETMVGTPKNQVSKPPNGLGNGAPVPTGYMNTVVDERQRAELQLSKARGLEQNQHSQRQPAQFYSTKKDKFI